MSTSSVTSGQNIPNLVVSGGSELDVQSGGTITNATIESGGSAVISVGGNDSGSTISSGGAELVLGSAFGDIVAGSQSVSGGTVVGVATGETVLSGGVVLISKGIATGTTVDSGGALNINGGTSATNTILSGGTVAFQTAKAEITGSLVFAGGGELLVTGNTSAGAGDQAVISGFGAGSIIDMTAATTIGAASSPTLITTVTSGNTVATVSGGGATDSYIFSGTAIGASLVLVGDGSGGVDLTVGGTVTSVGNGSSLSYVVVTSGAPLTVYAGGTVVSTTVLSGASATVLAGGVDSGAAISSGGSETLFGSANADKVYGSQTLSAGTAAATNEIIESGGVVSAVASGATLSGITLSGGTLALSGGGAVVTNATIAGGTIELQTSQDTLAGTLDFNGAGTLDVAALGAPSAIISGFYAGDFINLSGFGAGTTLATTTSGGNTVATVTSGGTSESLTFAGSVASNITLATSNGVAQIEYTAPPTTTAYTAGDLVLSIYGDGSNTGSYTLDQAAPITLEEIMPTGQIVSDQELRQTTTVTNGITEYAISGEYESASEGILTLAGNGESLVIAGYGVTAAAFDAANAATIYGTTALGQTTSLLGGQYTTVERVVADISYNASVDTSTSLSDIFNTNNPRSVYTINGTVFYLGGQGNGADGTEGVFVANDGASSATPIYNTKTDVRDVAINNGTLDVSIDSKSNGGGGLYNFGATLPTSQTTPIAFSGIGSSIVLTAAQANSVNSSAVGTSVNLSPEQYFFADPDTLYIADGGDPKEGGIGDGGLQKWSLNTTTGVWSLDYTLSLGLNQVADTLTTGTTGLVGLTGTVEGGNVVLYATNETVSETDQTYLYTITDPLAATTAPTNESFTLLDTAAPDTLIRGVAFAPSSASTTPVVSTALTVSSGVTSTGLTVGSGGSISVKSGGTIAGTTLLSGASTTISLGGIDSGTFIAHGASEVVSGAASYDIIDGMLSATSGATVLTSEVIENGGTLGLLSAGVIASNTTVNIGGTLYISGHASPVNTVISGGTVVFASSKSVVSGTLNFTGSGGVLLENVVISGGYGDLAVISGFGSGDAIDLRLDAAATSTNVVSGANVVFTVTSGASVQSFTFAGSNGISGAAYASGLSLTSDGLGGQEIVYTPPAPVDIVVSSAVTSSGLSITSNNVITVLSGGTMSAVTVYNGGSAVISAGGEDLGSTISAGGFETVSGDANGDQVYGVQLVTTGAALGANPATIENETVYNGGTIELYQKPDVATNITVSSGGSLLLSGNVSAVNTTLEAGAYMALQSPKAVISGGLTFSGSATVAITSATSGGFGGSASLISGWGAGDVIDETTDTAGNLTLTTSGGNTVATITGGPYPDVFVFSGTAVSANIVGGADGNGGFELMYQAACIAAGTAIMTAKGECLIERLQVGDEVLTASGQARPVKWLGYRSLDLLRHPKPHEVMPVRVRAGAISPGCPKRDVLLSPEHAVFIDDVLIPVRHLVNGATIVQEDAERITWWHVELETHDVILAEGLPTESYLDTGNRSAFANGGAFVQMHPQFERNAASAWSQYAYAPLIEDGALLETVRTRLAERAELLGGDLIRTSELNLSGAGSVRIVVPGTATTLRLLSQTGYAAGDRRRLGALITGLRIDGAQVALDDRRAGLGFHEVERHDAQMVRWTDGAASLMLGEASQERLVEVDVAQVFGVAGEGQQAA